MGMPMRHVLQPLIENFSGVPARRIFVSDKFVGVGNVLA